MHIHSAHNQQGRQEAKISWESENVPEMLAGNRGLMQAALPGQERGGEAGKPNNTKKIAPASCLTEATVWS